MMNNCTKENCPMQKGVKCEIEECPYKTSADVVEVKHGEWIENDNGTYSCSVCHSCTPKEQYYYDARYCLKCGAEMRERGEIE